MFTKGLNMSLPLWASVKKTVHAMEKQWLSGTEKVQEGVEWSVKKVMLTVFQDMKGPITIDFLEKVAAVNSTS